jgi:hypothetical protein
VIGARPLVFATADARHQAEEERKSRDQGTFR